jgi:DNA polymerase III delta prime subunit
MEPPPRRYTFATSCTLTAANKRQLVEALAPFVRDERDILGDEDLNGLLRTHQEVLRGHVKLWLDAVGPLQHVVNAETFARTKALLDGIAENLPRYVQTQSFDTALSLLEAHHTVIIAGPPGVGKTTLAQLLLLASADAGFTPFIIQSDIEEAWKLLRTTERQAFFFDDFLGRTALFDGVGDDTRDLAAFIREVRRSPQTRLILTTREYVLQRARQQVEELRWTELGADKYSLTLAEYSRLDKARIFYNHMYFSPYVDDVARESLRRDRGYLDVIDHKNYSPRLIEWMTGLSGHRLDDADRQDYAAFCLTVLDKPDALWEHAYDHGLTPDARRVLLTLPWHPASVPVATLEQAFYETAWWEDAPVSPRSFTQALSLLRDSFVRLGQDETVSAINPSLIDFLRRRLAEDPDQLVTSIVLADSFEQLGELHDIWAAGGRAGGSKIADALASGLVSPLMEVKPRRPNRWNHVSGPDREERRIRRLFRVCSWIADAPMLAQAFHGPVTTIMNLLVDGIGYTTANFLPLYVDLAKDLRSIEVDASPLVEVTRRWAMGRAPSYFAFEALIKLRDDALMTFTTEQWAEVQGAFEAEIDQAFENPCAYFGDLDALDLFAKTADELGVELEPSALDDAGYELESGPHEASYDPSSWGPFDVGRSGGAAPPEWDAPGGTSSGGRSWGNDAEIDGMFGGRPAADDNDEIPF